MKDSFFSDPSESLDLTVKTSAKQPQKRALDFIDFKLNQHLNQMGIKTRLKSELPEKEISYK